MQNGYAKIALVKLAATQHMILQKSVIRFLKFFTRSSQFRLKD